MDLVYELAYHLIAFACIVYCAWRIVPWCWRQLAAAVRKRGQAIEDDILLTHEADPYLAVLDEEHEDDWKAWQSELTAKARKLAEKLDGAR